MRQITLNNAEVPGLAISPPAKTLVLSEANGSMDVIINNAGIYAGGIQETFTQKNSQLNKN